MCDRLEGGEETLLEAGVLGEGEYVRDNVPVRRQARLLPQHGNTKPGRNYLVSSYNKSF